MELRDKIQRVLRDNYGEFETYLEREYETILTENLIEGNFSKKRVWSTYNQIILELKHTLKDMLRVKELQYKLTDTVDPNDECIKMMESVKDNTTELKRLYHKVTSFKK
jgi:hypothetical protein